MEQLHYNVLAQEIEDKERKGISLISCYDLLCDTKNFLDEYYFGCYVGSTPEYTSKRIFVSVEGYARFLKVIFKAVLAKHMIHIKSVSGAKALLFSIEFDASTLTENELDELYEIAKKSGFETEIYADKVVAKFNYASTAFSEFCSISKSIVYNMLKKILGL